MTSRLPKSRPTTAWATTAPATTINRLAVAAMMLLAAMAVAQTPSPPPPGTPAKTSWSAFPAEPPGLVPSLSVVPSPTASPPSPPAIGTRVVVFQKPAGEDRPVERPLPLPQDRVIERPSPTERVTRAPVPVRPPVPLNRTTARQDDLPKIPDTKDKEPPEAPRAKPTPPVDPKPVDIRLLDDQQLDSELIRSYNALQLEKFNRSREEGKKKPLPISTAQLPPSEKVRELLAMQQATPAPRSVAGAPVSVLPIEPSYVVHRRLYFEEKNSERYGWDLGVAQPFISAGYFYKDLLLYPMKLASNPGERYDTSAGKLMPGCPVPYSLYPPEITFGGLVIGSSVIVGTVFLLP